MSEDGYVCKIVEYGTELEKKYMAVESNIDDDNFREEMREELAEEKENDYYGYVDHLEWLIKELSK